VARDKKLSGRAALKEMAKKQADAMELVKINSQPVGERDLTRAMNWNPIRW